MNGGTEGDSRRRSGRRSSEPLQRISVGGPSAGVEDLEGEPEEPSGEAAAAPTMGAEAADGQTAAWPSSGQAARRSPGLDRIRPRPGGAQPAGGDAAEEVGARADRDPLGRAALYSTGSERRQPALGTFLLECSACRRETPVTAGDMVRLGIPSIHLLFVKRYPSLMRCPACGRRTWLRVHWRI